MHLRIRALYIASVLPTHLKQGAGDLADFLTKNGFKPMALHGNKSQTARTQALARSWRRQAPLAVCGGRSRQDRMQRIRDNKVAVGGSGGGGGYVGGNGLWRN